MVAYAGLFWTLREKEVPLPPQLIIEHFFGQEYFIQARANKYCYGSMGKCGTIENITEKGFDVVWEKSQKSTFKKKSETVYTQTGAEKKPLFMPNRENISIQLHGILRHLKQDKKGNCSDINGTYIGRIISESTTKTPAHFNKDSDGFSQKTLFFETPDTHKNLFILNSENIYVPTKEAPFQNFKILVAISSYKRPLFLSAQIMRFLNQTYQNFDISVSLKGFEKEESEFTFKQEWEPLIQQNKMRLTFDKNKGQLSNLLDTLRNVDLKKYDYICKVDDDDWYAPTYLETLNRHLNADTKIAVSITPHFYHLLNASNAAYLRAGSFPWPGATMCFQRDIASHLFEIEQMTVAEIQKKLPPDTQLKPPYTITGEDILIGEIARQIGKVQIRTSPLPLFIHGMQYSSMTNPF